jgi:hypothetical protein
MRMPMAAMDVQASGAFQSWSTRAECRRQAQSVAHAEHCRRIDDARGGPAGEK